LHFAKKMDFQQETTMPFIIKNTFLELEEQRINEGGSSTRRSSSLPRSFTLTPAGSGKGSKPLLLGRSDGSDTASTVDDTPSLSPADGESCSDRGSDQESPRGDRQKKKGDLLREAFAQAEPVSSGSTRDDEDAQSFLSCNDGESSILGDALPSHDEEVGLLPVEPLSLTYIEPATFGFTFEDDEEETSGARTPAMRWAETPSPPGTPDVSFTRRSFQPPVPQASLTWPVCVDMAEKNADVDKAAGITWPPTMLVNAAPAVLPEVTVPDSTPAPLSAAETPQEAPVAAAPNAPAAAVARLPLPQLPRVAAAPATKRLNALDLCLAKPMASRMRIAKLDNLRNTPLPELRPLDEALKQKVSRRQSSALAEAAAAPAAEAEQTPAAPHQCPVVATRTPTPFGTRWADTVDTEEVAVAERNDCIECVECTGGIEPTFRNEVQSTSKAKVALNLCLCLPELEAEQVLPVPQAPKTSLRQVLQSDSKPFTPVATQMEEAGAVVSAARIAIMQSPHVIWAEIQESTTDGPTATIVAEIAPGACGVDTEALNAAALAGAKSALLEAAASSSCVYIMGYLVEPFQEHGVESGVKAGFTAHLGFVPASEESRACWDTYQKGFCPRLATCRWCHPHQTDLVKVVVELI
jgi:hypothetical protein